MQGLPLALTLIWAPAVLAQEPSPGRRVRVETRDVIEAPGLGRMDSREFRLAGQVITARDTVTLVRDGAETLTLPRPATRLIGEVVALDADTLVIRLARGDVRVTVPRTAIERLDVSRGRRPARGALKGAAIGIGVGGGAGALFGYSSGDDSCRPERRGNSSSLLGGGCLFLFSAEEKALMGAVVFGALGGLVGAAIGATHSERWERVREASRKVDLGVRPIGTRGVALALRF